MWPLIAMAGSALLSMHQENQKAKQMKKYNEAQAEMTRYSPWTGRAGQIQQYTYDPLSAAAGGALQGLGMYQDFSKLNMNKPQAGGLTTSGVDQSINTLGSADMANSFGQMGQGVQNQYGHLLNKTQSSTPSLYSSLRNNNPFGANSFSMKPRYL